MAEKEYTVSLSPDKLLELLQKAGVDLGEGSEFASIRDSANVVLANEKADKAVSTAEAKIKENVLSFRDKRLNPLLADIPACIKLIRLDYEMEIGEKEITYESSESQEAKHTVKTYALSPKDHGISKVYTEFTFDKAMPETVKLVSALASEHMPLTTDKNIAEDNPTLTALHNIVQSFGAKRYYAIQAQSEWDTQKENIENVFIKTYSQHFLNGVDLSLLDDSTKENITLTIVYNPKDKANPDSKAHWGIVEFNLGTKKKTTKTTNGRGKSSDWLKGTQYKSATAYAEANADETLRKALDKWEAQDAGNAWKHIQAQSHILRIEKEFPKEKQLYTNFIAASAS